MHLLYLWPFEITRCIFDLSQFHERTKIIFKVVGVLYFFSSYRTAIWIWSLNNTQCALVLINCRPTSTGWLKRPWLVSRTTCFIMWIKFGKSHADISPEHSCVKIYPPRISLKRLPKTFERFVTRHPFTKYICVPAKAAV